MQSGMIDGQGAPFNPVDLNEAGIVVGNSANGGSMVIKTLLKPPLAATPDVVLGGASPLAINDHVRPVATAPAPPSATPTPTPSPIPAPQILGWAGNALAVWERQEDSKTWYPFGLEEMIPSMDGWDYLEPADMNDDGIIIGRGWFTDPAHLRGESHGFLLLPIQLMDIKAAGISDDVLIETMADSTETDSPKTTALIEPELAGGNPQMPQLETQFLGTEMMTSLNIEWQLEVKYDRGNGSRISRNQTEDTVKIPASGFARKPARRGKFTRMAIGRIRSITAVFLEVKRR